VPTNLGTDVEAGMIGGGWDLVAELLVRLPMCSDDNRRLPRWNGQSCRWSRVLGA